VLTVATGVLRLGSSSFTLGQALFQKGECIGVCESVTVHLSGGRPAPLPAEFRAALELHALQTLPSPLNENVGEDA